MCRNGRLAKSKTLMFRTVISGCRAANAPSSASAALTCPIPPLAYKMRTRRFSCIGVKRSNALKPKPASSLSARFQFRAIRGIFDKKPQRFDLLPQLISFFPNLIFSRVLPFCGQNLNAFRYYRNENSTAWKQRKDAFELLIRCPAVPRQCAPLHYFPHHSQSFRRIEIIAQRFAESLLRIGNHGTASLRLDLQNPLAQIIQSRLGRGKRLPGKIEIQAEA